VETESAFHEITVSAAQSSSFNPDDSVTIHKPEASPVLDAAPKDSLAIAFLKVARFPKATIEKADTGYRVELRDLRYAVAGESKREVAALFELNPAEKIVHRELIWAQDLRRR